MTVFRSCLASFTILVAMLLPLASLQAAPQREPAAPRIALEPGQRLYFIDPTHSSIAFTVPFMGIARVSGRFNQFYGNVVLDEQQIERSSVYLVIRTASIDTNLFTRDRDLRSENFFDVVNHPEMMYVGRRVERRGEQLVLIGELTLHQTTLPVEVPFDFVGQFADADLNEMGAVGSATLDRTEFGMTGGRFSGERMFVGDEVTIELFLRLREPGATKKTAMADNPPVAGLDPGDLVGVYSGRDNNEFGAVVALAGGLAYERHEGGVLYRMIPIAADRFLLHDLDAFVTLDRGARTLTLDLVGRGAQVFDRR